MEDLARVNREISWLSFNDRVLQEAANPEVPLFERLRFLAIFSNNLDEFFRVRVATIRRMIPLGKRAEEIMGIRPEDLLGLIQKNVIEQQAKFETTYQHIRKDLEKERIFILNEKQLDKQQGEFVKKYFRQKVQAALVPIMLRNVEGFPKFNDQSIYLAVKLSPKKGKTKINYAIMEIPSEQLPRFVVLPSHDNNKYIILLDDIIRFNLSEIFHIFKFSKIEAFTIKLTRDAELDIENDVTKSFLEKISESVKDRQKGNTVRFVYDKQLPTDFFEFLMEKLGMLHDENVIPGGRYHNFKDYAKFPNMGMVELENEPQHSIAHKDFVHGKSIIKTIKKKDILLNYPYHSFSHFIDLLREAAIDPAVTSIHICLYRLSENSKVVNALVNAAENGKEVTAVVELQARFDEAANILWSEKLQNKGVKVIFGVQGLKVHSKLCLITRTIKDKTGYYANISTGNYNEKTAKIYSDFSLFTSDRRITGEARKVFGFLEKNYKQYHHRHFINSPHDTRKALVAMINKEIQAAEQGKESYIKLKLNSLADKEVIQKFYEASQKGVKIQLLVRGICCLVPGLKGVSENIEARSIVDKYLEHGRMFIFCNEGNPKYFIGSSDLMTRNLDYRVEVTCPIYAPEIQKELQDVFDIQWADNVKARIIDAKLQNKMLAPASKKDKVIRSQNELYQYYVERDLDA